MDTKEMRKDLLKMALAAKSQGAHMGGSLSLVEIMAALYGGTCLLLLMPLRLNIVTALF